MSTRPVAIIAVPACPNCGGGGAIREGIEARSQRIAMAGARCGTCGSDYTVALIDDVSRPGAVLEVVAESDRATCLTS